jgi:predicted amidohydrolase
VSASLTIAAAQPRCEPRDLAGNVLEHAEAVREAQARVVIFPELSLTGYELEADPVSAADRTLQPIVDACAERGAVAFVGAPIEEDGRRFIAALRVDATGVTVAYRKSHLDGGEPDRFSPGDGATVIDVDGWRLGMGICKDTGVAEHTTATAELGIDVYVAGLVHAREELAKQDARGLRVADACRSYVAFASAAGPTGGGYDATAGESTIWSPDGSVIARASATPGDVARAALTRPHH